MSYTAQVIIVATVTALCTALVGAIIAYWDLIKKGWYTALWLIKHRNWTECRAKRKALEVYLQDKGV